MADVENTGSDNNNPQAEETETVVRKSWNFGHFGTRHDGEVWSLVRIKNKFGEALTGEVEVVSTNKSATPLVAMARMMNRVEKRDVKISKIRQQLTLLAAELNDLTDARDADVTEAESA